MTTEKDISTQIIDFVQQYRDKINKESFSVIEFVIQNGNLDGMRVKEYIKVKKKK